MAMIFNAFGQILQMPTQTTAFNFNENPYFEQEFQENTDFLKSTSDSFEDFFTRVHEKYEDMDTTSNIEKVVKKALQLGENSEFVNFISKETSFKDTKNRFSFTEEKNIIGRSPFSITKKSREPK